MTVEPSENVRTVIPNGNMLPPCDGCDAASVKLLATRPSVSAVQLTRFSLRLIFLQFSQHLIPYVPLLIVERYKLGSAFSIFKCDRQIAKSFSVRVSLCRNDHENLRLPGFSQNPTLLLAPLFCRLTSS